MPLTEEQIQLRIQRINETAKNAVSIENQTYSTPLYRQSQASVEDQLQDIYDLVAELAQDEKLRQLLAAGQPDKASETDAYTTIITLLSSATTLLEKLQRINIPPADVLEIQARNALLMTAIHRITVRLSDIDYFAPDYRNAATAKIQAIHTSLNSLGDQLQLPVNLKNADSNPLNRSTALAITVLRQHKGRLATTHIAGTAFARDILRGNGQDFFLNGRCYRGDATHATTVKALDNALPNILGSQPGMAANYTQEIIGFSKWYLERSLSPNGIYMKLPQQMLCVNKSTTLNTNPSVVGFETNFILGKMGNGNTGPDKNEPLCYIPGTLKFTLGWDENGPYVESLSSDSTALTVLFFIDNQANFEQVHLLATLQQVAPDFLQQQWNQYCENKLQGDFKLSEFVNSLPKNETILVKNTALEKAVSTLQKYPLLQQTRATLSEYTENKTYSIGSLEPITTLLGAATTLSDEKPYILAKIREKLQISIKTGDVEDAGRELAGDGPGDVVAGLNQSQAQRQLTFHEKILITALSENPSDFIGEIVRTTQQELWHLILHPDDKVKSADINASVNFIINDILTNPFSEHAEDIKLLQTTLKIYNKDPAFAANPFAYVPNNSILVAANIKAAEQTLENLLSHETPLITLFIEKAKIVLQNTAELNSDPLAELNKLLMPLNLERQSGRMHSSAFNKLVDDSMQSFFKYYAQKFSHDFLIIPDSMSTAIKKLLAYDSKKSLGTGLADFIAKPDKTPEQWELLHGMLHYVSTKEDDAQALEKFSHLLEASDLLMHYNSPQDRILMKGLLDSFANQYSMSRKKEGRNKTNTELTIEVIAKLRAMPSEQASAISILFVDLIDSLHTAPRTLQDPGVISQFIGMHSTDPAAPILREALREVQNTHLVNGIISQSIGVEGYAAPPINIPIIDETEKRIIESFTAQAALILKTPATDSATKFADYVRLLTMLKLQVTTTSSLAFNGKVNVLIGMKNSAPRIVALTSATPNVSTQEPQPDFTQNFVTALRDVSNTCLPPTGTAVDEFYIKKITDLFKSQQSSFAAQVFLYNMACELSIYNNLKPNATQQEVIEAIYHTSSGKIKLLLFLEAGKIDIPTLTIREGAGQYFSNENTETIARLLDVTVSGRINPSMIEVLTAFHRKPHHATPFQIQLYQSVVAMMKNSTHDPQKAATTYINNLETLHAQDAIKIKEVRMQDTTSIPESRPTNAKIIESYENRRDEMQELVDNTKKTAGHAKPLTGWQTFMKTVGDFFDFFNPFSPSAAQKTQLQQAREAKENKVSNPEVNEQLLTLTDRLADLATEEQEFINDAAADVASLPLPKLENSIKGLKDIQDQRQEIEKKLMSVSTYTSAEHEDFKKLKKNIDTNKKAIALLSDNIYELESKEVKKYELLTTHLPGTMLNESINIRLKALYDDAIALWDTIKSLSFPAGESGQKMALIQKVLKRLTEIYGFLEKTNYSPTTDLKNGARQTIQEINSKLLLKILRSAKAIDKNISVPPLHILAASSGVFNTLSTLATFPVENNNLAFLKEKTSDLAAIKEYFSAIKEKIERRLSNEEDPLLSVLVATFEIGENYITALQTPSPQLQSTAQIFNLAQKYLDLTVHWKNTISKDNLQAMKGKVQRLNEIIHELGTIDMPSSLKLRTQIMRKLTGDIANLKGDSQLLPQIKQQLQAIINTTPAIVDSPQLQHNITYLNSLAQTFSRVNLEDKDYKRYKPFIQTFQRIIRDRKTISTWRLLSLGDDLLTRFSDFSKLRQEKSGSDRWIAPDHLDSDFWEISQYYFSSAALVAASHLQRDPTNTDLAILVTALRIESNFAKTLYKESSVSATTKDISQLAHECVRLLSGFGEQSAKNLESDLPTLSRIADELRKIDTQDSDQLGALVQRKYKELEIQTSSASQPPTAAAAPTAPTAIDDPNAGSSAGKAELSDTAAKTAQHPDSSPSRLPLSSSPSFVTSSQSSATTSSATTMTTTVSRTAAGRGKRHH